MREIFNDDDFEWVEPDVSAEPVDCDGEIEPTKRRRGIWKKVGSAALALAIAFGVTETVRHTHVVHTNKQTVVEVFPRIIDQTQTIAGPHGCPDVKPAEVRKVKSILREKKSELDVQNYLSGTSRYMDIPESMRNNIEQEAKTTRLTLVDERPFRKRLDAAGFDDKQQLNVANDFAAQYGFSISILTGHEAGKGLLPFSHGDLSEYDFLDGFSRMMDAFRFMPVEGVRATGLKKLEIVKGFERGHTKEPSIAAQAVGSDTIQISLGSLIDAPEVIYHEMGHLEDYNFCGDFGFNYYDPSFDRLNPPGFEYGVGIYWRDATVSQYGASNIHEDKAEIFGHLLDGVDNSVAHSSYRAVREKYALALARASRRAPGLAQYLENLNH